jgi:hypothetical protein
LRISSVQTSHRANCAIFNLSQRYNSIKICFGGYTASDMFIYIQIPVDIDTLLQAVGRWASLVVLAGQFSGLPAATCVKALWSGRIWCFVHLAPSVASNLFCASSFNSLTHLGPSTPGSTLEDWMTFGWVPKIPPLAQSLQGATFVGGRYGVWYGMIWGRSDHKAE